MPARKSYEVFVIHNRKSYEVSGTRRKSPMQKLAEKSFAVHLRCLCFTDLRCSLLETPSDAASIAALMHLISFLPSRLAASEERRYVMRSEESITPGIPRLPALSEANTARGMIVTPSDIISLSALTWIAFCCRGLRKSMHRLPCSACQYSSSAFPLRRPAMFFVSMQNTPLLRIST